MPFFLWVGGLILSLIAKLFGGGKDKPSDQERLGRAEAENEAQAKGLDTIRKAQEADRRSREGTDETNDPNDRANPRGL